MQPPYGVSIIVVFEGENRCKKPNPPTPLSVSVGGENSPLLAGEGLGERSSRLLAPNTPFQA